LDVPGLGSSKEKHEEDTKEVLSYYAQKCKDTNFTVKLIGATAKQAGKRVCQAVEHFNIDYIAIGRRSSTGGPLRRAFSNTNSSHIAEHAECTVIVAKPSHGQTLDEKAFRTTIHSQPTNLISKVEEEKPAEKGHKKQRFHMYTYTDVVDPELSSTSTSQEKQESETKHEADKPSAQTMVREGETTALRETVEKHEPKPAEPSVA